jgi:protein tyrosine phosphatase (PTP) superfamily phosphohydrolase (DUF442 family)
MAELENVAKACFYRTSHLAPVLVLESGQSARHDDILRRLYRYQLPGSRVDIYNYIRIDDTLATSGQPSLEDLEDAARCGFEAVINLALHDDARYSLPDEAGAVIALGMMYTHIPVRFDAPSEADLLGFFAALDKYRGKRLLIHCAANKRVTAFLGLYRVIRQQWEIEPAFETMHQVWDPNPVWSSFIADMLDKLVPRDAAPPRRN